MHRLSYATALPNKESGQDSLAQRNGRGLIKDCEMNQVRPIRPVLNIIPERACPMGSKAPMSLK